MKYKNIITPKAGEKISFDKNGKINVPDNPIIPFIAVSYTHLTLPTKA